MQKQNPENEISLQDIVQFLVRRRMTLLAGVVIGLLFAVTYLYTADPVYEARWDLQVAQFVAIKNDSNAMVNSEDPDELVRRLTAPTSYPESVHKICGSSSSGEYLDGMLKVKSIRNNTDTVRMELYSSEPTRAKQCAEAISTMISSQQKTMIKDRTLGNAVQLERYQSAFNDEVVRLESIKKAELSNFSYLSSMDRLGWLRSQIDNLQSMQDLADLFPTKVVSPVYVSSSPVSPRIVSSIILGAFLGVLLGILYALIQDNKNR